jgi:hypothetical protein
MENPRRRKCKIIQRYINFRPNKAAAYDPEKQRRRNNGAYYYQRVPVFLRSAFAMDFSNERYYNMDYDQCDIILYIILCNNMHY